jgi:RNA polymerase sigma-B factor
VYLGSITITLGSVAYIPWGYNSCRVSGVSPLKQHSLELLRQYQQTPSAELRNRLVSLNFGLVRREVHRCLHQCNETYDDLMQVGCMGLIRAVERFDMTRGHAFSSFAIPYIRGEIQHYLRDKSSTIRIPRRWLDMQRQAAGFIRQWQIEQGGLPSDEQVSEALGISAQEWGQVKLSCQNRSLLSLDAPVGDESLEESACLGDMLPDAQYRSFQLAEEDRMRLHQALSGLENRTRHILEFVFLHDLTQRETAERLGISTVTVSRQVKKGLEMLKGMLANGDES